MSIEFYIADHGTVYVCLTTKLGQAYIKLNI